MTWVKGKVALVTGASRGIRATVEHALAARIWLET
jgi:NAD(P)-dependent dehydrogenase (short-subunit alcohol dehydrogenase family)